MATAITANELSEEVHVSLRHLRRLSGDGEVHEEKGRFGDEDVVGARVLPALLRKELCQRSALLGAPRRILTTIRVSLIGGVPFPKLVSPFQPSLKGTWLHVDQGRRGAATALAGPTKKEGCVRAVDKGGVWAAAALL